MPHAQHIGQAEIASLVPVISFVWSIPANAGWWRLGRECAPLRA